MVVRLIYSNDPNHLEELNLIESVCRFEQIDYIRESEHSDRYKRYINRMWPSVVIDDNEVIHGFWAFVEYVSMDIKNQTLVTAIKLMKNVPHLRHILEFGVWRGNTLTKIRRSVNDQYKVFGFDTFTGLPDNWTDLFKKGSFDVNGVVPSISGVIFYKGLFKDTIPYYKTNAQPIALLHIDCDLYNSTIDVLYGLNEYIVNGTIIVFDEWYYNGEDLPQNRLHEQKAFYEWSKHFNRQFMVYPEIEIERRIVQISG